MATAARDRTGLQRLLVAAALLAVAIRSLLRSAARR